MSKLIIEGPGRLSGTVRAGGAKNAVLPILAASILAGRELEIRQVPTLEDVAILCQVLRALGLEIKSDGGRLRITPPRELSHRPSDHLVRRIRASFLVLGPLVARTGQARVALPGGCAIGTRPVDLHLKGLEALGARTSFEHGEVLVTAHDLRGDQVYLDFPSVGATENLMMTATLASGTTVIENAAEEPEVVDLANFLNALGARIRGAGTKVIRIDGVSQLGGTEYTVIPDRIEAATFLVAAAITGGDVTVENALPEHLKSVTAKLRETGAQVTQVNGGLRVRAAGRPSPLDLKTLPYPGFPTDMQPQMMALLTLAQGTSIITETVFEDRFRHTDELRRMGAHIRLEGRSAIVKGVPALTGAKVTATDLRAGAALVLAGLAAQGRTEVVGTEHLDRGYWGFVGKLRALGACVERAEEG